MLMRQKHNSLNFIKLIFYIFLSSNALIPFHMHQIKIKGSVAFFQLQFLTQ